MGKFVQQLVLVSLKKFGGMDNKIKQIISRISTIILERNSH